MSGNAVLYILDRFPVRSERFIVRELAALFDAGAPVLPVALRSGEGDLSDRLSVGGMEISVARVPGIWNIGHDLRRLSRLTREPGRVLSAETRWMTHLAGVSPGQWAHLRQAYWLAAYAESHGARIMHGAFATLPATLACAAAMLANMPYTFSVHANDVFVDSPGLRFKLAGAAAVFACNRCAADAAKRKGAPPDRVVDIRHPLPDDWFSVWDVKRKNAPGGRKPNAPVRFLFAGRLVEKKGVGILLDAFTEAVNAGADIELDIAGSGPESARLATLPDKVTRRVRDHGWLEEAAYRGVLQSADALVAPSVVAASGDRDGIPNVIIEAFAAGVPVIATRTGGIADILTDGGTGVVIRGETRSQRVESLKKWFLEFDPTASFFKGISERARRFARETFRPAEAIGKMTARWDDILSQIQCGNR